MRVLRAVLALLIAAFLLLAPPRLLRGLAGVFPRGVTEQEPPAWEGIIELWHIVDFRAYQGSVTQHLRAQADAFCRAHPGVYIEVTGMSVEAFEQRYARGERPDAYSFPCGLLYREQLRPLPEAPEGIAALRDGLHAAEADGAVYAVPYLMSGYFLLMDPQSALLTGGRTPASLDEAPLQEALEAGRLEAPAVYAALLGLTGEPAEAGAFRAGRAGMALADARALGDLRRAEDGNLLFDALPATAYTDQVQYLGAAARTDETRAAIVAALCDFLLEDAQQTQLSSLGALPATGADAAYAERLLSDWNAACGEVVSPDPFLYQRHREALEADALRALSGESGAAEAFYERLALVLGR